MCRSVILVRLIRRFAASKSRKGDFACARLLASAPSADLRRPLLTALDEAMRGRDASSVAPELTRSLVDLADDDPGDVDTDPSVSQAGRRDGARASSCHRQRRP